MSEAFTCDFDGLCLASTFISGLDDVFHLDQTFAVNSPLNVNSNCLFLPFPPAPPSSSSSSSFLLFFLLLVFVLSLFTFSFSTRLEVSQLVGALSPVTRLEVTLCG